MRIRLNLATKALETHRRFLAGAGLISSVAGIIFLQKDIAELNARAAFINGMIDASSFNWTQMFMDLERILPGGVHVVSIEPKQVRGNVEVKLTVGAASDEAELKFLRALEGSKEFTQVRVEAIRTPNQTGNQSGDQKVIQLTTVYSRI